MQNHPKRLVFKVAVQSEVRNPALLSMNRKNKMNVTSKINKLKLSLKTCKKKKDQISILPRKSPLRENEINRKNKLGHI